eukprot:10990118-Lingulodinium_polyedra.AAC.1
MLPGPALATPGTPTSGCNPALTRPRPARPRAPWRTSPGQGPCNTFGDGRPSSKPRPGNFGG